MAQRKWRRTGVNRKKSFCQGIASLGSVGKLCVPDTLHDRTYVLAAIAEWTHHLEHAARQASGRFSPANVLAHLEAWREQIRGMPVVLHFGSARDECVEALSSSSRNLARRLAEGQVQLGLACMTGWGSGGVMGLCSREQVRAWGHDILRAERAPLVGVPLCWNSDTPEKPFHARSCSEGQWLPKRSRRRIQYVAPPWPTIEHRTGLALLGAAEPTALCFHPGGFGTWQELAHTLLSYQLYQGIQTSFTGYPKTCLPSAFFCDTRLLDDHGKFWFWDGLLALFRAQLHTKAIKASDLEFLHVVRIAEGKQRTETRHGVKIHYFPSAEAAALFILSDAKRVYEALSEFYASSGNVH